MVSAADPPLGHPQQLGPGRRQSPLGRAEQVPARPVRPVRPVLLGGRHRLFRHPGQRLAVGLAVGGQRKPVPPVEGRRDHVAGQCRPERLAQRLRRLPGAGVEGDQLLAPAGPLGDDHRAVPDAVHPQQGVLDLADLDPEAPDLDLVVPPAEELQLAAGVPAPPVTAQVEPFAGPVRVRPVRLAGPLGIVDVPPAHADTGERDQPRGAQRHQGQPLVHDVDAHVAHRASQQHPVGYGVQDLVVGVVRGLCQAVGVEQPDARLDREPALHQLPLQRLPGHRHAPQVRERARVPLQVGDHDLQIGGHHLGHADPAAFERVHEALHVRDHVLLDQQGPAADQQRRDQLPQRDVEALRRRLRHDHALADAEVVDLGVEMVEHARVLAHRPLGLAGGAGGEVDVGEPAGVDRGAEVAVVVRFRVRRVDQQLLASGQTVQRLVEGVGAAGFGQDQPAPRPRQRCRDTAGREVRLDRQIRAPRLEHRQRRRQPVEVAFGDDGDHVLRAQPPCQQRPRQPVRAPVELSVRPLLLAVHGRHRLRMRPYPLLEEFVRPCVRQRPAGAGQPLQLLLPLVRRQQTLPRVVGVHVRRHRPQRRQVVAADPGRGRGVQHVRAEPQTQHQPSAPVAPAHVQHTVVDVSLVVAHGPEHDLVRRLRQPQLPAQLRHRIFPGREELRLGVLGGRHQVPPGSRGDGQTAGQRLAVHAGGVPRHHLLLAGQCGQHLGVRRQQQRADRHARPPHQCADRVRHVVRDRRLLLGRSGHRLLCPAGHGGGTAGGQHPVPELPLRPVRLHARSHRTSFLSSRSPHGRLLSAWPGRYRGAAGRPRTCPRRDCHPTGRSGGLPRPS